jgi:hypothetical protein
MEQNTFPSYDTYFDVDRDRARLAARFGRDRLAQLLNQQQQLDL